MSALVAVFATAALPFVLDAELALVVARSIAAPLEYGGGAVEDAVNSFFKAYDKARNGGNVLPANLDRDAFTDAMVEAFNEVRRVCKDCDGITADCHFCSDEAA